MASSKVPDLTDAGTLLATDNLYVARGVDGDHKTTPEDILDYVKASGTVDNPPAATQVEMETGTEPALRSVSPLLVAQAIAALAPSSGTGNEHAVRQITEQNGSWVDVDGDPLVRTWTNPTMYLSTGDPAVPPPLNATSGMRENFDRYARVADPPPVLLVIGDASNPTVADTAIQERLEELGCEVTFANEVDTPPSAGTYVAAVIAESSTAGSVNAAWSTNATPVLIGEVAALDTLRLLSDDTFATDASTTSVFTIAASGHDSVGDLSDGDVSVYTVTDNYGFCDKAGLPAGGTSVAEQDGVTTTATAVVYESGATLTTGTAPARRAFAGHLAAAENWTTNGKALFDSLLYWVAGWDY